MCVCFGRWKRHLQQKLFQLANRKLNVKSNKKGIFSYNSLHINVFHYNSVNVLYKSCLYI